jgi:hypothetical protein
VGTNRYAYADNDPINRSDPTGHIAGDGGDPDRGGIGSDTGVGGFFGGLGRGEFSGSFGLPMGPEISEFSHFYGGGKRARSPRFPDVPGIGSTPDTSPLTAPILKDDLRELLEFAPGLAPPGFGGARPAAQPGGRTARDISVGPKAPRAKDLDRPIAKDAKQNQLKDAIVAAMRSLDFRDIRVNQQQINAKGVRVGVNRPDVSGSNQTGTRVNIEIDSATSTRGPGHVSRSLANDPSSVSISIQFAR